MCIFCKIINKEIPSYTVYEDDTVLAFLDIHPHAMGHTVVIPKKHNERLADMSNEEWRAVCDGLRSAEQKIEQIMKPDGINIAINDGVVAGQAIPHVHWHILPRYSDDSGGSAHSIVNNPGNKSVEEIAKLFI